MTGLTNTAAKSKLAIHGFNELPSAKPKNIWRIALEVVKEPMFLLLLSCGVLYMVLGDITEGIIMLAAILLVIGITFYQYRKTERALEALKKLSSPRVLVIRDGLEMRIAGRELVPEDIIILNEGDRIPADAMIIETTHLEVDESMLTGESIPVRKSTDESDSMVYSGTLVVQGHGLARVLSTGIHAQLGKIAVSLESVDASETRLQQEMKSLIRQLAFIGIFISISVVLLYYVTRGNFLQSLLSGISASMAILPEEFPVVMTVFLALGAWRLSAKNVLTRKSSAIESLGSATVLCSDKTGTITQNKMELAAMYNGSDIIYKKTFLSDKGAYLHLLKNASRASAHDSIDPMEKAISRLYAELFMENAQVATSLVKEYPLSKELLAMTRVLKNEGDEQLSISMKGSPEAIFRLCHLDAGQIEKHKMALNELAEQGFRVLGVAEAAMRHPELPDSQADFDFQFMGLVALEDPIRPEVPAAIMECTNAGVRVIMITGDHPATARSIARQCGLLTDKIISGDMMRQMSDEQLREEIKDAGIFARVVPDQKLRIVQALVANGEIVAMTGDGVNDAPALKAAHIGIAMGNKGTDVAREASSLVLLDDNFASIVAAIRLGRKIFDNLQKAMSYILAIHIPIVGLTLLPAFFPTIPILLMPLHIVFMELIIDPVCSIAFETEQEEKGIMNRPPRNPEEKFFGPKKISFSLLKGFLLLGMVLVVYLASIYEHHSEKEVRAIAFSGLIVGNIFLILASLSKTRYFYEVFFEKNFAALLILTTATVMLFAVISFQPLVQLFSFEYPGYWHFVPALGGALLLLLALEGLKFFRNH